MLSLLTFTRICVSAKLFYESVSIQILLKIHTKHMSLVVESLAQDFTIEPFFPLSFVELHFTA
jgi:hypothetical protein